MAAGSNQITPDSLKTMDLDALITMRDEYRGYATDWNALVEMINSELIGRHGQTVIDAMDREKKSTNRLVPIPGVEYKGERKKNVAYDNAKLMTIAGQMPWSQAQALFKIEVSVPENTYKALAASNPELKAAIDEARTVTHKDKITVERKVD